MHLGNQNVSKHGIYDGKKYLFQSLQNVAIESLKWMDSRFKDLCILGCGDQGRVDE